MFEHGIMQTGRNYVRYKFNTIKTFGWKIWEYTKGNARESIQGQSRMPYVCNGGHKDQYCICGGYGEPIHVEGQSTTLDECETH